MSEIQQNNYDLSEQILELKKTFSSVLKDFKKNYINYNLNPTNNEYRNILDTNKQQLQEINTKLYDLTKNIKNSMIQYYETNKDEIQALSNSKNTYNSTLAELNNLNDTSNATSILNDDYKDIYNKYFFYNLELFIGILIVAGITIKLKQV
jgi:hypothetical protein